MLARADYEKALADFFTYKGIAGDAIWEATEGYPQFLWLYEHRGKGYPSIDWSVMTEREKKHYAESFDQTDFLLAIGSLDEEDTEKVRHGQDVSDCAAYYSGIPTEMENQLYREYDERTRK